MDKAHVYTDKRILDVEKKISKIYEDMGKDIEAQSKKYFSQFEEQDKKKLAQLESEEITETEYNSWRVATMMSGKKWAKFLADMSKTIYEANKAAISLSNQAMTDVFIENYNGVGKDIEKQIHEIR